MMVEPWIDVGRLASSLGREGVFIYPDDQSPRRVLLTVNTTVLRRSEEGLVGVFRWAVEDSRDPAMVRSTAG
jgi:hypothetical protein